MESNDARLPTDRSFAALCMSLAPAKAPVRICLGSGSRSRDSYATWQACSETNEAHGSESLVTYPLDPSGNQIMTIENPMSMEGSVAETLINCGFSIATF